MSPASSYIWISLQAYHTCIMNKINSYSRALDLQRCFSLVQKHSEWLGKAQSFFQHAKFCPQPNPLFLPFISGEEYSLFLKLLRLRILNLNTDSRVCNKFWMHHAGMLENLGPSCVTPRDQTVWVSCHTSCQCPHRDAAGLVPAITWKDASQICALHFSLFISKLVMRKRHGNEIANGGQCRFGILMLFWHFSCPEDLLLYGMSQELIFFSQSFSFSE